MANYFNTLSLSSKLSQLGKCRFMDRSEFTDGCDLIKDWNIVIIGCGAQGLNQGLNMRDSGPVSFTLLTLPTPNHVSVTVVAVNLNKKTKDQNENLSEDHDQT